MSGGGGRHWKMRLGWQWGPCRPFVRVLSTLSFIFGKIGHHWRNNVVTLKSLKSCAAYIWGRNSGGRGAGRKWGLIGRPAENDGSLKPGWHCDGGSEE